MISILSIEEWLFKHFRLQLPSWRLLHKKESILIQEGINSVLSLKYKEEWCCEASVWHTCIEFCHIFSCYYIISFGWIDFCSVTPGFILCVTILKFSQTPPFSASLAQSVERVICNLEVIGSNPIRGSLFLIAPILPVLPSDSLINDGTDPSTWGHSG